MNRFTVELTTDTRYPNELNKAPVLIVDRITITPKILNAKVRTDAPMHLLKDIAAKHFGRLGLAEIQGGMSRLVIDDRRDRVQTSLNSAHRVLLHLC